MDISRKYLVQMVAEEVRNVVAQLREADEAPEKGKKKKGGERPETKDASDEPTKKRGPGRPKGSKNVQPPGDAAAGVEDPVAQGEPDGPDDVPPPGEEDLPGDDEMADDNLDAEEDEEDALDPEGDAGEEPEGEVAQAIQGLSVQSLTVEPESELLPGSREIVFTFADSPDVLRILVDKVGNVVFSWNGQLHDIP